MEQYGSNKKAMDKFYSMLSEIRASHRRDPKAATRFVRNGEDLEKVLAPLQTLNIPFSGEEDMGRYLDLHHFHHIFINSNFGFRLKYSEYVDKFPALLLDDDPKKFKGTQEYKDYIRGVLEYLVSFVDRAEPLMFLDRLFKQIESGHWRKRPRATAVMEVKVIKLCELLKDTLERTRQHVKNREGMTTVKELTQDRINDDQSDGDDDETMADAAATNAKKLTVGWDGKPIPYWLYKLHGLDKEYKCEICGDYTYKGRRAFENHFHQQRHQHGMHCLGIPNTKTFHEITSIHDAKTLWSHLQLAHESSQWNPDLYEEFEDDQGNVYPKRMFSDLLKQGLI